jgi:hypothetical protein
MEFGDNTVVITVDGGHSIGTCEPGARGAVAGFTAP